jgi:hypothetical protein
MVTIDPHDELPLFRSLAVLRAAHTTLLTEYQKYDGHDGDEKLPAEFIEQVERFLHRASLSGALLDAEEDRSDAQALLNYWTTVLYSSGQTPRPLTLARFEQEVVARQTGKRCPYRGLQAFNAEDRAVFYGRRQSVREATELLGKENFVAVLGLSGSGKSSLVRAGLIPQLQEGALPGSESWTYYDPIVPGSDPLGSLAELTRPKDVAIQEWDQQQAIQFLQSDSYLVDLLSIENKTTVVIVDQFEELFTLCRDEPARRAFVNNLVRLATNPHQRQIVIITMRTEFDTYVARYPELYELFERAQVRIPPLTPIALRKAIEKPAERAGLSFEAGLVEELVQQVLGEPAGLPLLQFTLYKLWEKRDGRNITWASYREMGGSPGDVLAKEADRTYTSFKVPEDRELSQGIMLKLVRPGIGLDITSNRVPRSKLWSVGPRLNVERVLDAWVAAGLLRVTPATEPENEQIEVMHEALVRNWPRLGAWVEEQREKDRARLRFTSAAQQWNDHKRDPGGLLGGTLLTEAKDYEDLSDLEKEFLEASLQNEEDIEAEKKRQEKRINTARRIQMWLASVFLVVSLALFAWAFRQTRIAIAARSAASAANAEASAANADAKRRLSESEQAKFKQEEAQKIARDAREEFYIFKLRSAAEQKNLDSYKAEAEKARKIINEYDDRVRSIQQEAQKEIDEANDVAQLTKFSPENIIKSSAALSLRQLLRPLRPGASISSTESTAGSLCCIVQDADGQNYLLSSYYNFSGKPGDSVLQPGAFDGGKPDKNEVARLSKSDGNQLVALASLLPGIPFNNEIPGIGKISAIGPPVNIGDIVTLVGRTSGAVRGRVKSIGADVNVFLPDRKVVVLKDVVIAEKISNAGDGGAPILDEKGRLVGILWGGGRDTSIFIPIDRILQQLNVRLAP